MMPEKFSGKKLGDRLSVEAVRLLGKNSPMEKRDIVAALKKNPAVDEYESAREEGGAGQPKWEFAFNRQSTQFAQNTGAGLFAKKQDGSKAIWFITGEGRKWLSASDEAIVEFAVKRYWEMQCERHGLRGIVEFIRRMNDDSRARMRESLSRASGSDVGDNPKRIARLWRKHYDALSPSDKALLPLRFIAFPDREKIGIK